MRLRMSSAVRREDSSRWQYRKRTPLDVLARARGRLVIISFPAAANAPAVQIAAKIGSVIKFSLRTTDPAVAKARNALAEAHVATLIRNIRQGPSPLSHRQRVAISGAVYKKFVELFEDEPGDPDNWASWKSFNRACREGRIAGTPPIDLRYSNDVEAARAAFGVDLTAGINALPPDADKATAALESRFGILLAWVASEHAVEIAPEDRPALLREIEAACTDAGWRLKRAAQGDYSPDPKEARFPKFERQSTMTLTALFERWEKETEPSASTLISWRGILQAFKKFLRHEDARRITTEDAIRWKDALVESGLSPRTINYGHIASMAAIFAYGMRNKLVTVNPFVGVKVQTRKRAGQGMLPYTTSEVKRLLELARSESLPYRRWLPWLTTFTGARVGEMAQLWGNKILVIDGVHCFVVSPADDGGTLKNKGSERIIPIHSAIIHEGFLDFVATKGEGPLFYRRNAKGKRHASKGVANHLADWIRENGFNDKRKAPSHALRHWFKSEASRVEIPESVADRLQGHALKSEGDAYRHFDIPRLAREIEKIANPVLATKPIALRR